MTERPPRLAGKVAIVAGAGSSGPGLGNGKATSVLFTREGAKVLLADAVAERALETLAMIKDEGGEASVFRADVTNADDCRRMVETAVDRYGRLDILDNNVGIFRSNTVLDISEEEWDYTMAVNVKGIILASRYAIPRMLETGGGSIINISSIAGLRVRRNQALYSTSKHAVIGLTRSMAVDYGRDNIRVNAIAPGPVYTPMVGPVDEATRKRRIDSVPLGTEGTAWDVAWAAVYLASDEARWVSGVVIPVDAGLSVIAPVTYAE